MNKYATSKRLMKLHSFCNCLIAIHVCNLLRRRQIQIEIRDEESSLRAGRRCQAQVVLSTASDAAEGLVADSMICAFNIVNCIFSCSILLMPASAHNTSPLSSSSSSSSSSSLMATTSGISFLFAFVSGFFFELHSSPHALDPNSCTVFLNENKGSSKRKLASSSSPIERLSQQYHQQEFSQQNNFFLRFLILL